MLAQIILVLAKIIRSARCSFNVFYKFFSFFLTQSDLNKMSYDYSQEVINDLEKLLTTETAYDVIIYAGENEDI